MTNEYKMLTPRQLEIVRLLLAGNTAEEIAIALYVTNQAVYACLARAREKIGAKTNIELIVHVIIQNTAAPPEKVLKNI